MKRIVTAFISLTLVLALVGSVFAQETTRKEATGSATTKVATISAALKERVEKRVAERKDRLADKRLENCKKVEVNLRGRVSKLSGSVSKAIDKFHRIHDKIEDMAKRRRDQGKDLSNYDKLIDSLKDARAAAQALVDDVKNPPTFDCTGDNPKEVVAEFNESFKAVRDAFKAYHKALRDVLVAIASVTGQTNKSATSSGTR